MDAEAQRYIKEQIVSGLEEVNDSGIVVTDYYRKRMRYSHVIFLTSILESAMRQECERLAHALGNQVLFKPENLKGDSWTVRRVFLEKYGSFEIPDSLWDPIKELLNIRNTLIHQGDSMYLLTPQQISALGKIPGIRMDTSEVEIEEKYIDRAIDAVRNVMEFLHDKTNDLIDRAISPKVVP
jgi:hypothetical protein